MAHVGGTNHATCLSHNGAMVETVEHLLAAMTCMGLDNAIVELDHREVPVMDGSSAPFVYLIQEAGLRTLTTPRRYLKVLRPVTLSRGDKLISLYPSDYFKVTYSISFDHPLLRHQSHTLRLTSRRLSTTSRRRGPSGSCTRWNCFASRAWRWAGRSRTRLC